MDADGLLPASCVHIRSPHPGQQPLLGQARQLLREEVMDKMEKKHGKPNKKQVGKYDSEIRRKYFRASSEIFKPINYGVKDYHNRQLQLPHDYQYTDAKPKSKVSPGTIFGEDVDLEAFEDRRDGYAQWMTSPENPRFTKSDRKPTLETSHGSWAL